MRRTTLVIDVEMVAVPGAKSCSLGRPDNSIDMGWICVMGIQNFYVNSTGEYPDSPDCSDFLVLEGFGVFRDTHGWAEVQSSDETATFKLHFV